MTGLEYTAHPSALARLEEVGGRGPPPSTTTSSLAAVHRVGRLAVGDLAVVVGAAAPHRDRAFEVGRAADRRPQARGAHLEAPDLRPTGPEEWVAASG